MKVKYTKPAHEVAMVEILGLGNAIDNSLKNLLAPLGLTNFQFNVLRILNGAYPESLKMGEIKDRMISPHGDMTRMINRMIEKGLVQRVIDNADKRKVYVSITKRGITTMKQASDTINKQMLDRLDGQYQDNEYEELSDMVQRMRQIMFGQ